MKKILSTVLAVCLLCEGVVSAIAATTTTVCGAMNYHVVFLNGVNNSVEQANTSAMLLQMRTLAGIPKDQWHRYKFHRAYNNSHGLYLDLMETEALGLVAAAQKNLQDETGDPTLNLKVDLTSNWQVWMAGVIKAPQWFSEIVMQVIAKLPAGSVVTDNDVSKHIAMYWKWIKFGDVVLLQTHSAGGLVGNRELYLMYDPNQPEHLTTQSIIMSAVATPADHVEHAPGVPQFWVRDKGDLVIAAAALLTAGNQPLGWTVDNGDREGDIQGHAYGPFYRLARHASEDQIQPNNMTALSLLKPVEDAVAVTFEYTAVPISAADSNISNIKEILADAVAKRSIGIFYAPTYLQQLASSGPWDDSITGFYTPVHKAYLMCYPQTVVKPDRVQIQQGSYFVFGEASFPWIKSAFIVAKMGGKDVVYNQYVIKTPDYASGFPAAILPPYVGVLRVVRNPGGGYTIDTSTLPDAANDSLVSSLAVQDYPPAFNWQQ